MSIYIASITVMLMVNAYGQFNYETNKYEMRNPNSYYLPENWPQHELQLSSEGNFVDIFKAGLNPHYIPGMEDTLVEIKHARVSIRQFDGKLLPEFEVEHSKIRPLVNGQLYKIVLVSQPLTTDQARKVARKWLPFISKTEEDLSKFLEAVEADPVRYIDRDFGAMPEGFSGGWSGKNNERFSVWFRQNYNVQVPLRLCLRVNYKKLRTRKEFTTFIDSPIEAPEGFKIGRIKNFGPDDTSEVMYAKGIPFLAGRGLSGINQSEVIEKSEKEARRGHLWENQDNKNQLKNKKVNHKNLEKNKQPAPEKKSSRLPWLIVGVLLCGILLLLLKGLRGKST